MVFEVFDTNPENPRAMFGGGRYDNLLALFGGEELPAVGFGIGEVTLGDFLDSRGLLPVTTASSARLYLGTPSPSDIEAAQAFATTLRAEGLQVFVNLTSRALGDQIKDAVKRGIPYFAAYGAQELKSGSVRVKTLASGEESQVLTGAVTRRIQQAP
jgi:histidyl-tRNA synthetase